MMQLSPVDPFRKVAMQSKPDVKENQVPVSGITICEDHHAPGYSGRLSDGFPKFLLVIAGHATLESEDQRHFSSPNYLLHIPSGQICSQTDAPGDPVTVCVIRYRPELLSPGLNSQLRTLGLFSFDLSRVNVHQANAIRSLFQEMLFEQEARQQGWEMSLHSKLFDLAVRTLRLNWREGKSEIPVFEPGDKSADRIARYALCLKTRFFEQGTIGEAARAVGLSRRRFTELFRKVTGQSWRKYIMRLRLKHAAKLLAETDRSVITVAFESGFEDLSHFYHSFKAAHQCSPVAYREQRRVYLLGERAPQPISEAGVEPPSGFKFRGIKGWFWTPEQYLEEIPGLPELKLNFLMNCYGSMMGSHPGKPERNEWWKRMSVAKKQAWFRVIEACRKHEITFCFSLHPQLASPRPLDPTSEQDIEQLFQHYAWAQGQGVQWFSVCLDDTSWGSNGPAAGGIAHARLVNALFDRLQSEDPKVQFAFCPLICWGDATNREHRDYLGALAHQMHPNVYVFWNGDSVVTPRITRVAAENYRKVVGHRLFLWDNYPVNDGSSTIHLGPVSGRAADLCDVVDGYLSNAMCAQNQINRIPLASCADYASNPRSYNPVRSIRKAILRQSKTSAQQQVL
ncbi:MAG: beta-N-acetylglucosaminidase domain-containing protein, partial [Limisphaerales bacterium]